MPSTLAVEKRQSYHASIPFYIFAKLVGHSIQRLTQKQVFLIFSIIYPQLKNLILQIIIIQYNDYQQQHGVST